MKKLFRFLFLLTALLVSLVAGPAAPVRAQASLPAEINKQFTPLQIDAGGVSVLRISIFNPNTFPLTDVAFIDNMVGIQPGLYVANPAGVVNTCGGTVTAVPNTTTIELSGGGVPAQTGPTPGQCYIEVNVSSVTPGNLINTIPAHNPPGAIGLTAQGIVGGTPVEITNTSPASATITVIAVSPPSLSKTFSPNTIFVGETSELTIRLNNNDVDTNLTGVSYTDNLPSGVVIATPNGLSVSGCGGGAVVTAPAGGTSISLTNGTVTPSVDCLISVDVTGAFGQYTNTIPAGPGGPGSLQTNQGVTNNSPASAPLNIQPVGVTKAFSPDTVVAGGASTLTITLQNPTGSPYTGVSITDNLPSGITVAGAPSTTCGAGVVSGSVGDSSVTLTGGTIPASATPPTPVGACTITVPVQAGLSASGSRTNTIPANALLADQPAVTNYSPATDVITITPALSGTKAYSPTIIPLNGVSTVTITLTNNSATPLTNLSFTDVLPANLDISGIPASPQCGGTVTFDNASNPRTVTLAGGSLAAAPGPDNTCTITFQVTSDDPGSGTTYENTIPTGSITTDEGVGNNSAITTFTDLTVINSTTLPVGVSKSFLPTTVTPGQASRVRIIITAPADQALTGITFTDTLPPGLVVAESPPAPAPTTNCTGGVVTAPAGGNTITLTGGTRSAGASCNIDVRVVAAEPGTYDNIVPANSITTSEGRTNEFDSNTATLRVTSMTMSKAFYPTTVQANGLSTMTITLQNTSPSALINVDLLDDLPGSDTNGIRVAPVPNASTTCGAGVISFPDAPPHELIQLTGGTIPAASGGIPGICTITLDVQGLDSSPASPSAHTNTIPVANVTATVESTGVQISPSAAASAELNIRNLSIGVVKGFDPVLVYGGATSTMTIQLINPGTVELVGIAFTDNMDLLLPGIVLADPVNFNTGTCGGALTGNPGDASFSFSGGFLLPNNSCFLTLQVVMEVNGNRTNRIPAGAVTTFNGVSSTQPTEASLTNLPGVGINKVFNPNPVQVNDIVTLTLTISNTSNIPVVNMGVNDNLPGILPAGLAVANPPNVTNTCGGTVTANPGDQVITLSGGGLAGVGNPGSTCQISVSVTTSQPGAYVNTIPAGAITADGGVTNNDPTTDTLIVGDLFSLGNRVWFDTNNNSQIDAGEVGVDDVTVQLYAADGSGNPTGAVLATQVTSQGGYYRFDNLAPGDYVVVIPASQFDDGEPLAGYWSSGTTIASNGDINETPAPDPDFGPDGVPGGGDDDRDSDDNGTRQTSGPFDGAVISSAVTLGPGPDEPTDDTDAPVMNPAGEAPNDRSNRTVDFGFYNQQLGNLVFVDVNGNGTYNAGTDTPLEGAVVRLYSSDGTEINVGPDGILGTADDAPGGVTTGPDGLYLFSGLPQGDYIVQVTPPPGLLSTVDTANPGDTANPNNNIDNNDNGVGTGSGTVSSNVVTLTPGSSGAAGNNTVSNPTGTTTNPTVDFGFTPLYSLGNRVWFDTDNSSTINGSEVGVNGVTVQLYAAGDLTTVLATDTTANGGYYRFDDLPPGDYVVVIPASQFASGGPLAGYWSSGTTLSGAGAISETTAPDPDNDVDSDDNGTLQTGGAFPGAVVSSAVTLGPGTDEPTNDTDADPTSPPGEAPNNQSNRTVDFGFYRVELGNLVFVDVNGNGTFDAGDLPLSGATVQLFASDGVTEINVGPDGILGTADDAPGGVTTGADGLYLFSGLPEGNYIVRVTPPVGYASTVDTADSTDTTNPSTNTDNNDNGVGEGLGQTSSNPVTLTPGAAQTNNTVSNPTGTTTNPTVDFGFRSQSGLTKTLEGSSETHTIGNQVTIGEIVTYEVRYELPLGTPLTNVTLTDRMELGLAFVDCLSVVVAGTDVTAAVCPPPPPNPPAEPVVSAITDPGGDPANPANPGRQVVFTLGNIPAQSSASAIVIRYRAIVLDVLENQSGDQLNNSVTLEANGSVFSASAPEVEIIEPFLNIDKTATPTENVPVGTPVQFTLEIYHTTPQSQADAFDVIVTDILPPNLQYVQCTVAYSGWTPNTPAADFCNPGTTTTDLIFFWDVFPLGQTATITFNAILLNSPATNVARVEWTSLEIDPGLDGLPIRRSVYNDTSHERWYDPPNGVDIYSVSDSVTINAPPSAQAGGGEGRRLPVLLPATGFAPGRVTALPEQPKEKLYSTADVWLEIPSLGLKTPIVGVPLVDGDWDVSWLWRDAGWLNGTAFPGWSGNSALTGHVVLPDGTAGPFAQLANLRWGDRIIVYAYGSMYTYEVRENRTVSPYNTTVLKSEKDPWLTLITCENYIEANDTYANRITVRAVLIGVGQEAGAGKSNVR